jgi:hypothetical protein
MLYLSPIQYDALYCSPEHKLALDLALLLGFNSQSIMVWLVIPLATRVQLLHPRRKESL